MKFIVALVLTSLLAFIFGLYFAWWTIAIAAFVPALLVRQRSWVSGLAGFSGIFLLWVVLAAIIDSGNKSILSTRVGELMGIGANPVLLIIITGFVAGLVGFFGALTGHYTVRVFLTPRTVTT